MSEKSVLVIDDDVFMRQLAQAVLEPAGYQVRLASGGREGLAQLEADRPDVVVLDYAMPEVGGVEVLQTLRAHHPDPPPVIVLSAWRDDAVAARIRRLGATWLDKPVSPTDVLEAVRSAIAQDRGLRARV